MRRVPGCLLALVASWVAASAAPRAKAERAALYFPTTVGDKWKMQGSNPHEVVRVEEKDGVTLVTVVDPELKDEKGQVVEATYEVSASRVCLVSVLTERFDPPECLLRLPAKPGTRWKTVMLNGRGELDTEVRTVRGEEEVKTAAGKFNAIVVDIEFPAGEWSLTEWYAPGRGVVQRYHPHWESNRFEELESFTSGKK
jgi:hypothetical protein